MHNMPNSSSTTLCIEARGVRVFAERERGSLGHPSAGAEGLDFGLNFRLICPEEAVSSGSQRKWSFVPAENTPSSQLLHGLRSYLRPEYVRVASWPLLRRSR